MTLCVYKNILMLVRNHMGDMGNILEYKMINSVSVSMGVGLKITYYTIAVEIANQK